MSVTKEVCHACDKSVYPQERLSADARIYHKACFRCKKCSNVLKLGSYASMDGEVFCKVCFKKNFFTKGNYSEGFGKLKPQEQHDMKTGNKPVAIVLDRFSGVNKNLIRVNTVTSISSLRSSMSSNADEAIELTEEDIKIEEEERKQARKMEVLNLDLTRKKQEELDKLQREEKKKGTVTRDSSRRTLMVDRLDLQLEKDKFRKERELKQEIKEAPNDENKSNSNEEKSPKLNKNNESEEEKKIAEQKKQDEAKLKKEKELEIAEAKKNCWTEETGERIRNNRRKKTCWTEETRWS